MKKFTWETETCTACKAGKLLLNPNTEQKIANLSYSGPSTTLNYIPTSIGCISLFSCWILCAGSREAGSFVVRVSVTAQVLHSLPILPYLFQKRITLVKGEKNDTIQNLFTSYIRKVKMHSYLTPEYLIFDRKHRGRCLLGPPASIQ